MQVLSEYRDSLLRAVAASCNEYEKGLAAELDKTRAEAREHEEQITRECCQLKQKLSAFDNLLNENAKIRAEIEQVRQDWMKDADIHRAREARAKQEIEIARRNAVLWERRSRYYANKFTQAKRIVFQWQKCYDGRETQRPELIKEEEEKGDSASDFSSPVPTDPFLQDQRALEKQNENLERQELDLPPERPNQDLATTEAANATLTQDEPLHETTNVSAVISNDEPLNAIRSSQTTEVDDALRSGQGGSANFFEQDSDPVVVFERPVKRKYGIGPSGSSSRIKLEDLSGEGSANSPLKFKQEDTTSSDLLPAAQHHEDESFDLDDVASRIDTPHKRRDRRAHRHSFSSFTKPHMPITASTKSANPDLPCVGAKTLMQTKAADSVVLSNVSASRGEGKVLWQRAANDKGPDDGLDSMRPEDPIALDGLPHFDALESGQQGSRVSLPDETMSLEKLRTTAKAPNAKHTTRTGEVRVSDRSEHINVLAEDGDVSQSVNDPSHHQLTKSKIEGKSEAISRIHTLLETPIASNRGSSFPLANYHELRPTAHNLTKANNIKLSPSTAFQTPSTVKPSPTARISKSDAVRDRSTPRSAPQTRGNPRRSPEKTSTPNTAPTIQKHRKPAPLTPSISKLNEQKPTRRKLRECPPEELTLDDFRLNASHPANDGASFAFRDSVRTNAEKACLPGCIRLDCCGAKFRKMAEMLGEHFLPGLEDDLKRRGLWKLPEINAAPQTPAQKEALEKRNQNHIDDLLLKEYLGNDYHLLKTVLPAQRQEWLLQARTKKLAEEYGKHRQRFERAKTPPGFWRVEFPSTQENNTDKDAAEVMEREKIRERYAEARREGRKGRWIFRDEVST